MGDKLLGPFETRRYLLIVYSPALPQPRYITPFVCSTRLIFFLGCTFLHLEKRREEEKKGKVERFTQAPLSKNSHLNVRLKRSAATHLVPFRPSAFLSGDNTQHIGTGDEINFCVYPSLSFSRYLLRRSRHRHQTAEHQGSDFATLAGELGHETIKSKTLASWTKA